MKKFLAAVLSLCIMLGINVSAYADETLTLTATIPEQLYTLNVPSGTQALTYGNTDYVLLGEMTVRDEVGIKDITIKPEYRNLKSTDGTNKTIALELYALTSSGSEKLLLNEDGVVARTYGALYLTEKVGNGYSHQDCKLYAKVPDWSSASLGKTYQATITYHVNVTPLTTE